MTSTLTLKLARPETKDRSTPKFYPPYVEPSSLESFGPKSQTSVTLPAAANFESLHVFILCPDHLKLHFHKS